MRKLSIWERAAMAYMEGYSAGFSLDEQIRQIERIQGKV
jgi:hypothetical protein